MSPVTLIDPEAPVGDTPSGTPRDLRPAANTPLCDPERDREPVLLPRVVPAGFLLTTGVFERTEPMRWLPHRGEEHLLLWSERGAATVLIAGELHTILPGRGVWIPAGVAHEGSVGGGVAFRETIFAPESWTRDWSGVTAVLVPPAAAELLLHLARAGMPPEDRRRAQRVCMDLLHSEPESLRTVPLPRDPRLAELVGSLIDDPADGRSLEQWSQRVNVSSRTITRIFAAEVAMSFVQWRRLVRIRAAHALLAEGESVTTVGRRVGYRTPSAFVAAFRQVEGRTPGQHLRAAGLGERAAVLS